MRRPPIQSSRSFAAALALPALFALVHACSNVQVITPNLCGNGVIEPEAGEDCDKHDYDGMKCRKPGSEGECRFDCTANVCVNDVCEDHVCLGAYQCGSDAICSAPKGELVLVGEITDDARVLFAADFDGDGSVDLLSGAREGSALSYLSGFDEQDTQDLPQPFGAGPVTSGQLTEDEISDVVYVIPGRGIGVDRGSAERQLLGTAYPTYDIPIDPAIVFLGDAEPNILGTEAYTIFNQDDGPPMPYAQVIIVSLADFDANPKWIITMQEALPEIADDGEPTLEGVPSGPLSDLPCEQYVLAYRGRDRVFIGTACRSGGTVNGELIDSMNQQPPEGGLIPLIEVDLTQCPIEIDRAFLIDVDLDDDLDVVLTPRRGGDVCFVKGPLRFADDEAPALPAFAESDELFDLAADERVHAVEHLNGDGVPDFVTTFGAFVSQDSGCEVGSFTHIGPRDDDAALQAGVQFCAAQAPGRYSGAAVGDINGNGVPDLALALAEGEQVRVLSGHADGTYAEYLVETEACVAHLEIGDFDGDGLDDIVFADRPCDAGEGVQAESDLLAVAFGRVSGGPEEPRSVGSPGAVQQLVAGKFLTPAAGFDALEEIGLVARDVIDQESLSFSILNGSTSRQLQAPFALLQDLPPAPGPADEEEREELAVPTALATGRFAELDAGGGRYVARTSDQVPHQDLAVVAIDPGDGPPMARLWLLASEGEAELSISRSWDSAAIEVGAWEDHDPYSASIAAANLDRTPADQVAADETADDETAADELVYVSGRGLAIVHVTQEAVMDEGVSHPVFSFDPLDDFVQLGDLLVHADRDALTNPLVIRDLDGDGAQDIVVVGQNEGKTQLLVLWNQDGKFELADARSTMVALDAPALTGETIVSFLPYNFDDDAALEILVGHTSGVVLYDLEGRKLRFKGVPSGLENLEPLAVWAMAAADFDQDGVDDLVLGTDVSMTLYRSLPIN